MKKLFLLIVSFFLVWNVFSIEQEKLDYLENLWIKVNEDILSKQQISRYKATRYLNYAQCFDCMLPPQDIKNELNFGWFQGFKEQEKIYLDDIDSQDDYYYCVTNLAKLDYIHGFPNSNPICWWEFCWSNTLSFWELFQIVVNIISPNIWDNYAINNMETFHNNIMSLKSTQQETNMNITSWDYELAESLYNQYTDNYTISSFDEFFLYQKYCNLYPEECNFQKFWNIEKWNYALSMINILYDEWLISSQEWANFNPSKKVSWEELINWLYKVKQINDCSIDNDYDKDGILNNEDNAIYNYNPNQKDTDNDGIWDVYDDDIDGDWFKNPIWIVDEDGNIVPSKITDNMDNCLFTVNPNQEDTNNNNIWDACENQAYDIVWIEISCSPLSGNAPLPITCNSNVEWDIKKIIWTYDWEVIWEWKTIEYTFPNPWDNKITATAILQNNDTVKANSYFKVWQKNIDNGFEVWLQAFANPTSWPEWTKVTFQPKVEWDIDFIRWDFGDGSIYDRQPKQNLLKTYSNNWTYQVIARWYKDDEVVWVSYMYIKIYADDKPSSYLQAQPLLWYVNQDIEFSLITSNINQDDIEKVIWNFQDGNIRTTNSLKTTHNYNQSSSYPVKATIYLNNGKKIDNFITQKIIDKENNKKYGAILKADPLKQDIWKQVNFTIIPDGFDIKDAEKITWNFDDWIKKQNINFKNSNIYHKSWKKTVNVNIILKNKDNIELSLTLVISWNDICLTSMDDLSCDMDEDGIPDMCDEDIDGDNVPNLLWLMLFEKQDCTIDDENTNTLKLKEEQNLAKNGWDIDNCPFAVNADQIDINDDGIWDVCDIQEKDTDGDGIPDDKDACPYVPEDINGIQDLDGCPELPTNIDNELSLKVDNCDTCPCHFADYGTPFIDGLNLKALLVNPYNPSQIYKVSQSKMVK